MKKKIALLIAAIMIFSAAIPNLVFADSRAEVSYTYTNAYDGMFGSNLWIDADLLFGLTEYDDYVDALDTVNATGGLDDTNVIALADALEDLIDAIDLVLIDLGYEQSAAPDIEPIATVTGIAVNTYLTNKATALGGQGAGAGDSAAVLRAYVKAATDFVAKYITAANGFLNSYNQLLMQNGSAASSGAFLRLTMLDDVSVGDKFDLILTNGIWGFSNNTGTLYNAKGYGYGGLQGAGVRSFYPGVHGDDYVWSPFNTTYGGVLEAINGNGQPYAYVNGAGVPIGTGKGVPVPFTLTVSNLHPERATIVIEDDTAGSGNVNAQGTYEKDSTDPFEVWVPLVFLSTTDDEPVTVTLDHQNIHGTPFTAFSEKIIAGKSSLGSISIRSAVTSRNVFELDRITIKERTPGDFREGGSIYLIAPKGYHWPKQNSYSSSRQWPQGWTSGVDRAALDSVGLTIRNPYDPEYYDYGIYVEYQNAELINYEADQILEVRVDSLVPSVNVKKYAAEFYIQGLVLEADENAPFGDVYVRATDFNVVSDIYTKYRNPVTGRLTNDPVPHNTVKFGLFNSNKDFVDLKAAVRKDYGINFTRYEDKAPVEIWAGRNDQIANRVVFAENTPVSWWANNLTEFTLVDEKGESLSGKVKLVSVVVNARTNMTDIRGTYNVTTTTGSVRINDDMVSIAYTPIDNTVIGNVSFTCTISAAADYVGPVYLHAAGRGNIGSGEAIADLQIADVKAPFTIETKKTNVEIGYQTYKVEDITIKEVKAGIAIKNGNLQIGMQAFGVLDGDMKFIDAQNLKMTYNEKAGLLGKPVISGSVISIPVTRMSSTIPFEITLSNVKLHIDRTVPQGNYDLAVGGDAFVDNYMAGTIKTPGMFNAFGVTYKDYVEVKTLGVNKALSKNVVVQANNEVALVDGAEYTLGMPIFIDPATSRTMIPIRFISTALGLEDKNVIWDDTLHKVTIITPERTVEFFAGTNKYTINGAVLYMVENGQPVNCVIKEDRSFVPLAYLARAYGITVAWNAETKQAYYNPTDEQIKAGAVITYDANAIQ